MFLLVSKRQAKMNADALEEAPVQLLSTVWEPSLVESPAPNERSPDPRFKRH